MRVRVSTLAAAERGLAPVTPPTFPNPMNDGVKDGDKKIKGFGVWTGADFWCGVGLLAFWEGYRDGRQRCFPSWRRAREMIMIASSFVLDIHENDGQFRVLCFELLLCVAFPRFLRVFSALFSPVASLRGFFFLFGRGTRARAEMRRYGLFVFYFNEPLQYESMYFAPCLFCCKLGEKERLKSRNPFIGVFFTFFPVPFRRSFGSKGTKRAMCTFPITRMRKPLNGGDGRKSLFFSFLCDSFADSLACVLSPLSDR